MIKVGSTIIYGSEVCKVTDIKNVTFGKVTREYYVLSPVYDEKNVIYAPTDNPKLKEKMKEILSSEEIIELIRNMPENESFWIEDDKERVAAYKETLEKGNREDVIRIIKTLYEHKCEVQSKGKKLHSMDEILFQRAEKMIYDEFALVLDIKREEVTPFILRQIEISPNK